MSEEKRPTPRADEVLGHSSLGGFEPRRDMEQDIETDVSSDHEKELNADFEQWRKEKDAGLR